MDLPGHYRPSIHYVVEEVHHRRDSTKDTANVEAEGLLVRVHRELSKECQEKRVRNRMDTAVDDGRTLDLHSYPYEEV